MFNDGPIMIHPFCNVGARHSLKARKIKWLCCDHVAPLGKCLRAASFRQSVWEFSFSAKFGPKRAKPIGRAPEANALCCSSRPMKENRTCSAQPAPMLGVVSRSRPRASRKRISVIDPTCQPTLSPEAVAGTLLSCCLLLVHF